MPNHVAKPDTLALCGHLAFSAHTLCPACAAKARDPRRMGPAARMERRILAVLRAAGVATAEVEPSVRRVIRQELGLPER